MKVGKIHGKAMEWKEVQLYKMYLMYIKSEYI